VNVVFDEQGLADFVRKNKGLRDDLMKTANKVKATAEATASSAEEGPGGRIDGYASAGFEVVWEQRSKRPRVLVRSKAPIKTALAAHFHTMLRDGVPHLNAALYEHSSGSYKRFTGKFKYRKGKR
jgi:hypothetical protein